MSELNFIKPKLLNEIRDVLIEFPSYWDNGELIEGKLIDDLRSYKAEIIQALLSNDLIKNTYSLKIEKNTIFKLDEFISMLRFKQYWGNNYTKYTNDIGLTSEGKYINYNEDVVLDFPYKDSVLEGGMTKEDVGKKEVFYHNVLAKEEIDVLLDKKILVNAKKYDENGNYEIDNFDENDNLIIKGNNLLALHTLKERYARKVKMVYIDPPYNTKGDSFSYNDRFNHSSWLTFMKNRLEVARSLLKNDGVILVHCDDNEVGYLNVLMDNIFGRENKISIFPRITKRGGKSSAEIAKNHDYILLYSKEKNSVKLYAPEHDDDGFNNKDEYFEERGYYKLNQTLDYDSLQYSSSLDYPIELNGEKFYPGGDEKAYKQRKKGNHRRADWAWRWSMPLFKYGLDQGFIEVRQGRGRKRIYTKTYQRVRITGNGKDNYRVENIVRTKPLSTLELTNNSYSNDNATKHAETLKIKNVFDYTKPESMISKLMELTTRKYDIILDFFMGSGTTQAVAHKMNRRYIGIEQMDYINTISIPRLQKVIEGEQGGISKEVGWKGGGSFVYAELYELNHKHIQDVLSAESEAELETLLDELLETEYLNFKVDFEKLSNKDGLFEKLTLEQKKNILIEVLDLNQLYLNYSEIADEKYDIPEGVKRFNHSFYQNEVNDDGQT